MLAMLQKLDRLLGVQVCPDGAVTEYRLKLENVQRRIDKKSSEIDRIDENIENCKKELIRLKNIEPVGDWDAMQEFRRQREELRLRIKKLTSSAGDDRRELILLEEEREEIKRRLFTLRGKVSALTFSDPIQRSMYVELCTWDSEEIKQVAEIRSAVQLFLNEPMKENFDTLCRARNEGLCRKIELLLHLFQTRTAGSVDMSNNREKANPAIVVEECFITVIYLVFSGSSYDSMLRQMQTTIAAIKNINTGSSSVENCNLYTVLSTMEDNGWFVND